MQNYKIALAMAKICVVEVFFGANDFADYFQREGRASDVEFNTDFVWRLVGIALMAMRL